MTIRQTVATRNMWNVLGKYPMYVIVGGDSNKANNDAEFKSQVEAILAQPGVDRAGTEK